MNYKLNFFITSDDIRNKLSSNDREKYKYIKFTDATVCDKQVCISCVLLEEPITNDEKAYLFSSIPNNSFSLN